MCLEPAFFAQLRTFAEPDSAGLRITNNTNNDATVFVEEEISQDDETTHIEETVDWLLFEMD